MELKEYIQHQIYISHLDWDDILQRLTDEQFNWKPPGIANTLAETALHTFGVEDYFIQRKLLEQPMVWETGGWAERLGLETYPDYGNGWAVMRGKTVTRSEVMEYEHAVTVATGCFLESLAPGMLEKPVMLGSRERSTAEILSILILHTTSHQGEMAALMGLLGLQGQVM